MSLKLVYINWLYQSEEEGGKKKQPNVDWGWGAKCETWIKCKLKCQKMCLLEIGSILLLVKQKKKNEKK